MKVFNTNQARHLYVATKVVELTPTTDPATALDANGAIGVVTYTPTFAGTPSEFSFVYKNGDGIITRSDLIDAKKVEYANVVSPGVLDTPLKAATVTTVSGLTLTDLIGKHVQLTVNLREFIGLNFSERYPITVDVYGDSTNTASAAAFYKVFEDELKAAIASFHTAPFAVTSSGSGLVITEAKQKWVRGKLSADPIHFEVVCHPVDDMPWGSVAVADSGSVLSGSYALADLEYFTHTERSEVLGYTVWPNNYEWTPLITPADDVNLSVLTIQYYYNGAAEDVQKSPKTIHIVGPDAVIGSIVTALRAISVVPEFIDPADERS